MNPMKSNRFFPDTSYVLALINPRDTYDKHVKIIIPGEVICV